MVQIVLIVCTQNLWRELHFEMLTMKNAGFHPSETYYPPFDAGSRIYFRTFLNILGQVLFSEVGKCSSSYIFVLSNGFKTLLLERGECSLTS